MKSIQTYLIALLAIAALVSGALAWNEYRQLIGLRAQLLDPDERLDLENQLARARKSVRELEDQLAALRGRNGRTARGPVAADGANGWADRRARFQALANDPKFQELWALQRKAQLDGRYGPLFKLLNLTSQQLDQFKNLLVEKQQAGMDAAAAARQQGLDPQADPDGFRAAVAQAEATVDAQIQATLGPSGYAQYQQYQQQLPEWNTINQLQQTLSYTSPLTDDQANQLVQILASTSPPARGGNGVAAMLGFGNQSAQVTDATISQATAAGFPPSVISALQTAEQNANQINAARQQMRQVLGDGPPMGGP